MSKTLLLAALLAVIVFGLWRCSTRWQRQANRIIRKECNCFDAEKISLSSNVEKMLATGNVEGGAYPRVWGYEELSISEKKELKKFAEEVFDINTRLGGCLNKVKKEEKDPLNNYQTGQLYNKIYDLIGKYDTTYKKKVCNGTFYLERGAMDGALYMTTHDSTILH